MTATKTQLREVATSAGRLPSGVDLMRQISEGGVVKAPNEFILDVKSKITEACDELIELGARVRPLVVDGQQIGWVRGVHNTERRRLSRWVHDPNEVIISVLTLATSLKREQIEQFSGLEIRNLVELVQKMTWYDMTLYPYLSAFTSTMASENLWHGRGTLLTSFENREIHLPDGQIMRVLAPSEHARLWATLCVYREQAKVRLDANWNAILQVRPLAGKSVDPLANELKALGKQLATESIEPWENVIRFTPARDLDDGWAHAENLDTQEGMLKELHGMLNDDKHEQLMAKFEKQQIEAAEERKRALKRLVPQRELGVNEETMWVETDASVRKRELDLKKGRIVPKPIDRDKTELEVDPVEKMKRYK
jgi:hypothetical protein